MSCRPTVFSHNELVCSIAETPRDASQAILKACYEDMKEMIREEEEALKTVANLVRGVEFLWKCCEYVKCGLRCEVDHGVYR